VEVEPGKDSVCFKIASRDANPLMSICLVKESSNIISCCAGLYKDDKPG
jgi:hypothetical protein